MSENQSGNQSEKKSGYESVRLMGLWKSESKNGMTYLQGTFTSSSVITIFPNNYKDDPAQPDYIVYLNRKSVTDWKKRKSGTREEAPVAAGGTLPDDDIAF